MRKLLPLLLLLSGLSFAQYSPANYCADAGASDTYACNLSPSPIAYVTGTTYFFKANTANTGAATINYNGIGAKTIVKVSGGVTTALSDNEILAGQIVELSYDGTNMQIQSTLGTTAYNTVQNNGTPLTQRTTLNCTGNATCSDSGGKTVINVTGGGGATGNSITNVTPVTVSANTTGDQTMMELGLTAGFLNSLDQPFMFNAAGVYTTPVAQTPTLTFKVKLCTVSGCGSGTVVTLVSIVSTATLASVTNNNWNFSVMGYTAATGATGNLEIHGPLSVDLGALTTTADSIFNDTNIAVSGNIDLTAALFVDFTVATSTGSASNSITQRQGGVMPFAATAAPVTSVNGLTGAVTLSFSTRGIFASRPSCGASNSSATYFATDAVFTSQCNGTSWLSWFGGYPIVEPPTTGWSWQNQGGATVTQNGAIILTAPPNAGDSFRQRVRNAAAPPYTIVSAFTTQLPSENFVSCGVEFRESSSGKIIAFWPKANLSGGASSQQSTLEVDRLTNDTTFGSASYSFHVFPVGTYWLRIGNDNTNLTYSWSPDGINNWTQIFAESKTAYFSGNPDQVGIVCDINNNTSGLSATMNLVSWQ